MSGTRSHSRPAQATDESAEALVVVAHGDCGGLGENQLARELARRLRQSHRFASIDVAYLKASPSLEDVVSRVETRRLRLYPLFLSDGYYVQEAIPRRLSISDGRDAFGHEVTIETPLGLNPQLPAILAEAAVAEAERRGIPPDVLRILLVGHGSSKSRQSAQAAARIKEGMERAFGFAAVELAFLEEEPRFSAVLPHLKPPALVLGLFAGGGMHATDDVSAAITALSRPGIFALDQLGGYARIIEAIVAGLV